MAQADINSITVLPNSRNEFNTFNYAALSESADEVKAPGFFKPLVHQNVVQVGDRINVFVHDINKQLSNYVEVIFTHVDKINGTYKAITLRDEDLSVQKLSSNTEELLNVITQRLLNDNKFADRFNKILDLRIAELNG